MRARCLLSCGTRVLSSSTVPLCKSSPAHVLGTFRLRCSVRFSFHFWCPNRKPSRRNKKQKKKRISSKFSSSFLFDLPIKLVSLAGTRLFAGHSHFRFLLFFLRSFSVKPTTFLQSLSPCHKQTKSLHPRLLRSWTRRWPTPPYSSCARCWPTQLSRRSSQAALPARFQEPSCHLSSA